ncbi:MAG: arsenite efflux transporter metallochaperone ArsD [Kiritimatiellia bacterium]|jgi:hypothetical protein|nr:arsenite efflux transporter metallochaperone ArsD [Kiritimatiellia bacterium]
MKKLEVFDPPMCCSSGVCGPNVNPVLPRFAGDLEWLKGRGVKVARYNLAQQPMAFAENASVREALEKEDVACLPLVLADGRIVSRGVYPAREELAALLGLAAEPVTLEFGAKACGSGCCCNATMGSASEGSSCCG